jgi:hypothetical protein
MRATWDGDVKRAGAYRLPVAFRALCPDGRTRVTAWIAESPDTYFSHPAVMRVGALRIAGYVTERDGVLTFEPYLRSPRPASWPQDIKALGTAAASSWRQAREAIGRARAARWCPIAGGDASAANKRRCAKLFRAYVREACEHRAAARAFQRVMTERLHHA